MAREQVLYFFKAKKVSKKSPELKGRIVALVAQEGTCISLGGRRCRFAFSATCSKVKCTNPSVVFRKVVGS